MGFNYLRPPIGETIFNKSGIINEVWNKFFNEIVGIEQFKELEGIVANHVLVGYDISSTDYVAGTSGWRIASDSGSGVAEFNIPIISYEQLTGTIAAAVGGSSAAGLTGETSGDTAVRFWAGSTFANRATAPFRVLQNGTTYMTGAVIDSTSTINGSAASGVLFTGQADLTATIISNGVVTTGTVEVAQGGTVAAGITGNTSGDTAVRFWAGSSFANRSTAPFRVLQNGTIYMTGAIIDSTSTISGTASSTVVSNASTALSTANSASSTANTANSTANTANTGVSNIISGGTTSILGGKITTSLIGSSGGAYIDISSGSYITMKGGNGGTGSALCLDATSTFVWGYSGTVGMTGTDLRLSTATSQIVYAGGSFYPFTGETVSLGAAGKDFNTLYISAVLLNGTQIHDVLDDLDTLHSVKALPDGKMNLLTLPKEFTSFDLAKAQLIKQSGDMLSPEDAEAALLDHDDMAHIVSLNLGEFVNLIEGAVRQLDRESSEVQYETLDWLNDIDKRLKKIEKEKSNA